MTGYRLSKRSLSRLVGLHPALAFAVIEAIGITQVDFGVIEGVRTIERQRELVAAGKSKTLDSYHLYGLAVDLVPYVGGRYVWDDDAAFAAVAGAMKQVIEAHGLKIDWGWDLWEWDKPHWQMTGMKTVYDVRRLREIAA